MKQLDAMLMAAAEHSGIMVALVPRAEDAQRLALETGEPADELHVTLFYFGDASAMPLDARRSMAHTIAAETARFGPLTGKAFGFGVFNPTTEKPALVLNVGGDAIADFRRELDWQLWPSDQHRPWNAHLTLAYLTPTSEALSLPGLGELAARMGSVTFDRVRVAFAGEAVDIPFSDPAYLQAAENARAVYEAGRAIVASRGATPASRSFAVCKGKVMKPKVDGDTIEMSVVAAVEGVRRPINSAGPELVLASQLEASIEGAVGMPVSFDHPQVTSAGGTEWVSINDPRPFDAGTGVLVGASAAARIEETRMVVEVVASLAQMRAAGQSGADLAAALERGETTEVSLGYYAVTVPAAGIYEGEPYTGVHSEIEFDHCALLPLGVRGACAVSDGCGTGLA